MRKCILILLLALSSYTYSQNYTMEQVCELTKCSDGTKILIRVTEDSYFEGDWPKRPYFFENVGSIVIGESLSFEAISDKNGNISLSYIPAKTETSINIKLSQPGNEKNDVMTMASIDNGSSFNLIYQGGIYHTETGTFSPTSVCSILSGKGSFESWPYAVSLFSFSDLKSVSQQEASEHGCK